MILLPNMSKLKIKWATEARDRWRETALYIRQEWGFFALQKFKEKTEECQDRLEDFPALGKVEPLLEDRSKLYRSLVLTEQNKIIYYIEDNTIYIVDFWDTRREPKAQASKLR